MPRGARHTTCYVPAVCPVRGQPLGNVSVTMHVPCVAASIVCFSRRTRCPALATSDATPLNDHDSQRLASDFRRLNRLRTLGGASGVVTPFRLISIRSDCAYVSHLPDKPETDPASPQSGADGASGMLCCVDFHGSDSNTSSTLRSLPNQEAKPLAQAHSRHGAWTGCCKRLASASSSRVSRT